jgi:hypothetical protein
MTAPHILRLALYALAGAALGSVSLFTLRLTARLYMEAPARAVTLHVARLATLGAILVLSALQGAGPLIALAAGLTLVRPILVRRLGGVA